MIGKHFKKFSNYIQFLNEYRTAQKKSRKQHDFQKKELETQHKKHTDSYISSDGVYESEINE